MCGGSHLGEEMTTPQCRSGEQTALRWHPVRELRGLTGAGVSPIQRHTHTKRKRRRVAQTEKTVQVAKIHEMPPRKHK